MVDWNPKQYARFARERRAPFDELLSLIAPTPGRVIDLGCGTGELTRALHDALSAASTLGVDSSAAMLEQAKAHAGGGLTFAAGDLADVTRAHPGPYDVVFSNAALQWLPDLTTAIRDVAALVAPGGQYAVQVPQNYDHPSHVLAAEVASEPPFAAALGGYARRVAMTPPEAVSSLLFDLGFRSPTVRLSVFGHELASTRAVVEWVKGTLLLDYERRLTPELYAAFVARYEARLVAALGDHEPYFYPFKRLLFHARRA